MAQGSLLVCPARGSGVATRCAPRGPAQGSAHFFRAPKPKTLHQSRAKPRFQKQMSNTVTRFRWKMGISPRRNAYLGLLASNDAFFSICLRCQFLHEFNGESPRCATFWAYEKAPPQMHLIASDFSSNERFASTKRYFWHSDDTSLEHHKFLKHAFRPAPAY